MNENNTRLGKIIGSNDHIDYVCEIYNESVLENPPNPTDYEFGQFVYISKDIQDQQQCFVGVIYDTWIVDPDQGRTGPKLSSREDQEVFVPTYVDEKMVLAGVALLGSGKIEEGQLTDVTHSIPRWTLEVDDEVRKLSDEDMLKFHTIDGEIKLQYYQRIIDVADSFAEDILSQILEQLQEAKPEEAAALEVIRQNLHWQTRMGGI